MMAMNVLLLEDRGSIAITLKDLLEYKGYVVCDAFNPADADGLISGEEGVDIHAIILDLNLPTDGLTPEEADETVKGLFSGWVWFTKHVYPSKPKMVQRTIVYSAYLDDLKMHLGKEGKVEDMKLLDAMKQFKKREGSESPVEELLKILGTIENNLKRDCILK